MSINLTCGNDNCAKRLRVREELAGKQIRCPACGRLLLVPDRPQTLRSLLPPCSGGNEPHNGSRS